MSKLTNNFMEMPHAASPAQARSRARAPPPDSSDEDPEVVSVPEGPSLGSTPYRRGSARTSAASTSPAGPAYASGRPAGLHSSGSSTSTTPGKGYFEGNAAAAAAVTRKLANMDVSHAEDSCSSPVSSGLSGRTPTRPAADKPTDTGRTFLGSGARLAKPAAEPLPGAKQPGLAGSGVKAGGWGEMTMEDVDDLDASEAIQVPWGATTGPRTTRAPGKADQPGAKGKPLAPDQARALKTLLWGAAGQPAASWKQGFFFNSTPGLQFGLVQSEGGPCGVLAAVQAYLLSALRTPAGRFNLAPSRAEQQAALVGSLTDIIWQARQGSHAYLAVADSDGSSPVSGMTYDQLLRGVTMLPASSRAQLEELVRSWLNSYMDSHGWGIHLLLVSVLLSRGVEAVRDDMDDAGVALMGMHGYCTQELVNLITTGQASSNVFDGEKQLDEMRLRGITRRCRVGLLTLFEWYKYVEVGSCLKSPDLPIWIVCSESHFTVLFSQEDRALKGSLPFDLHYYDQLANQQGPLLLSLSRDPSGGWTAKMGDTIGDRGRCEGQNIPPLECVIETRWPGVKVDWNGSDPIL